MIDIAETKGKRVVLYLRVSSGQQRERCSIERQNKLLPAQAAKLGMEIVGTFADDGVKGGTADRPGLSDLTASLHKLRPAFIMFLRPDRLGRPETREVLHALTDLAEKRRIDLIYLDEDELSGELLPVPVHHNSVLELHQLEGKLILAGQENKRRGRDVQQGNLAKLLNREWPFPRIYGFAWDQPSRAFRPVEAEIAVIRHVFDRLANHGETGLKVAEGLRGKHPTPRAAKEPEFAKAATATYWRSGAIWRILDSEHFVTGKFRYDVAGHYAALLKAMNSPGNCLTPDGHVEFAVLVDGRPVIDPATYKRAKAAVGRRRTRKAAGERRWESQAYLFGPWLMDACGAVYRARTKKRGDREWRYYTCARHVAKRFLEGRAYCPAPPLRADDIDARLWDMVLDLLMHPTAILEHWAASREPREDPAALRASIDERAAEIARHERKRGELADLFDQDGIDRQKLLQLTREHANEITRLSAEVEALQRRLDDSATMDVAPALADVAQFETDLQAVAADLKGKMDALPWAARRAFLKHVLGDGSITLVWQPVASFRAAVKRHGDDPDAFLARWMVKAPAAGETDGLFVKGISLPVRPSEILEAMAAAGIRWPTTPRASGSRWRTIAARRPAVRRRPGS